jgi:hypothetical protein
MAGDVITRFISVGEAIVELHSVRFTTHWTYSGPPFAADKPYVIDGFNWRCLGCGEYGREDETYDDPAYREATEARTEAQAHAAACRALPVPEPQPEPQPGSKRLRARWPARLGFLIPQRLLITYGPYKGVAGLPGTDAYGMGCGRCLAGEYMPSEKLAKAAALDHACQHILMWVRYSPG